jgi:hypothetical protein
MRKKFTITHGRELMDMLSCKNEYGNSTVVPETKPLMALVQGLKLFFWKIIWYPFASLLFSSTLTEV